MKLSTFFFALAFAAGCVRTSSVQPARPMHRYGHDVPDFSLYPSCRDPTEDFSEARGWRLVGYYRGQAIHRVRHPEEGRVLAACETDHECYADYHSATVGSRDFPSRTCVNTQRCCNLGPP